MQPITTFLFAAALCTSTTQFVSADYGHGAIRITLPNGEQQVDSQLPCPGDVPQRPWYLCENFDYYGSYEGYDDPTYELDYETQWPGEREDFSDYFMR